MQSKPGFATSLALFYGAIFLIVGVFLPYFPVWLKGHDLSDPQIAVIISAPLIARLFFTPLISFVADYIGDRRRVLVYLSWGTFFSLLLMAPLTGFWPLLGVSILFGVFWTTVMPLTESIAMTQVRQEGMDYGRVRLWGSATFILASWGGGLAIDLRGAGIVIWLLVSCAILVIICVYLLPAPTGKSRLRAATPLNPIKLTDALRLFRSSAFIIFLVTAASGQAAHAVFYSFGTLHWQGLGISNGMIGLLWAIGVIAEIILFVYAGRVFFMFGATKLLWIAAIASVVRWSAMAFDPPLVVLFPLQILHGLTFGAAHLGAIRFISEAVREEYTATGQGLYASFSMGIVMGAVTIATGPLYQAIAGYAYLAMSLLGLISLAGAALLGRIWREGEQIEV